MNINIYYGGRGLVDDPTILVINKIQEVLDELNVNVNRYNLYEMKNTITTLSLTVIYQSEYSIKSSLFQP